MNKKIQLTLEEDKEWKRIEKYIKEMLREMQEKLVMITKEIEEIKLEMRRKEKK